MFWPKSISAIVVEARFITLLKSYSRLGSGNSVIFGWFIKLLRDIVFVGLSIFATVPVATFVSSFLNKISILSPTFKLDLSISSVNKTILEPDIFWIKNLEEVLYIHEFANICFLDLFSVGFSIFSPTFLTVIFSPSVKRRISVFGTNLDKTPVNLNSTFLLKSPPSYPK